MQMNGCSSRSAKWINIVCEHFPRQSPSTPSCDFGILAPVDLSKMAKGSWDQLYMDQPWTLIAWKVSCIDRLSTLASTPAIMLVTEKDATNDGKTQKVYGACLKHLPRKSKLWSNAWRFQLIMFHPWQASNNSLATLAGWNTNLVTATFGVMRRHPETYSFWQKPFSCTRRCNVVKCYVYPASNMDKLKKKVILVVHVSGPVECKHWRFKDSETLPSNITETLR